MMPDSSTVDTLNHIRQSGQLEEMGSRIDKLGQHVKEIFSATESKQKSFFENAMSEIEKKMTATQNLHNMVLATKKTVEEVQRSSISKTSVVNVFESEKKLILDEVKENSTKLVQEVHDMQRSLQREYKESMVQLSRSFHEALNSSLTQMTATLNNNMHKMKEEIKTEIQAEVRSEVLKVRTDMKAEYMREKADLIKENQAVVLKSTKSIKECLITNMTKQDSLLMTHITNCTRYFVFEMLLFE